MGMRVLWSQCADFAPLCEVSIWAVWLLCDVATFIQIWSSLLLICQGCCNSWEELW